MNLPPDPTHCPRCGFMPASAVTVCKQCGADYLDPPHLGDAAVFATAVISIVLSFLIATGQI